MIQSNWTLFFNITFSRTNNYRIKKKININKYR